jgi:lipopolysaccharide transport system permease protein
MHHRLLIGQLTRREILGRYKGSVFGMLWSFINPLILLAVYTFVFSFVFKTRWGTGSDSKVEFALALFAGLIIHGLLSECINRAPYQIINNPSYVKKVVFPLETLSWVTLLSTLFHTLVSIAVWLIFFVVVHRFIHPTLIFLPLILLPLLFYALGLSWFLASLGVYLRDVSQITGILSTLLLFMSPILYPISAIPEKYQIYLYLNPLTFIIEQARDVMMWGKTPDWSGLSLTLSISLLVAWAGFAWFQTTRRGFADVI